MKVEVQCDQPVKKIKNFWNHIHFHPTDAIEDDWGQEVLDCIAKDGAADMVRIYTMFEDMVTMDADGQLQYDFSLNDQRMDYMVSKGFRLFISYNFIPACIAAEPELMNNACQKKTRYKGKFIITSPPKDYKLWEEICYQYTKHIVERYGLDRVKTWRLQCLNEPDHKNFWMQSVAVDEEGTQIRLREYCKLYKGFVEGIEKVSKELKVGGPSNAGKEGFFTGFLDYITANHLKIDFISIHTYGVMPRFLNDGSLTFDVKRHLTAARDYYNHMKEYNMENKELIMDEWGACTNGDCTIERCPKLVIRENEAFSAYYAKLLTYFAYGDVPISKLMICLCGQHGQETYFCGGRSFFTKGFFKKPIYNFYVLAAKLGTTLVEMKKEDVNENVSVMATDKGVLAAYVSDDLERNLQDKEMEFVLRNCPGDMVRIWCIDKNHINPYTKYREMGMPEELTPEQIKVLKEEGELRPIEQKKVEGVLKETIRLQDGCVYFIEFL